MTRALEVAAQGKGRTSPNPMVGCVIVEDGQILSEGYHSRAGEAHAEVEALRGLNGSLNGKTVYVTLEPCCHTGKTPPCTKLFLEDPPLRVVVAMEDPNPKVAGKGVQQLRDAGIQVDVGVLETEARQLNEIFVKHITTGRPFVIAKCAMTLDGKIATHTGHSQWVTGETARHQVHVLRNEVDGILVGSRTVMLDDPSLTTRLDQDDVRDPIRIVLDAGEYLDENRKIFQLESKAPTWIATASQRVYDCADDTIYLNKGDGGVHMDELFDELGKRGITSLLIEGGGTTLATAFEAGLVDKVMFFVAPKIAGGKGAITPVEGLGVETMDEAYALDTLQVRPVGEDILIEAYVKKEQ